MKEEPKVFEKDKLIKAEQIVTDENAAVDVASIEGSNRYPDVFQIHQPDQIIQAEREENDFFFTSKNKIRLRISVFGPGLVRITYALKTTFGNNFSYAISPDFRPSDTGLEFEELDPCFNIKTDLIVCRIDKENLLVTILDLEGNIISKDAKPYEARTTILNGIDNLEINKIAYQGEQYIGLGDKSSAMNLRGRKFQNWNTDAFAYGYDSDPLYKTIPFYYVLNGDTSHGIFFDNTYRTHFDFAATDKKKVKFSAVGGEMNYYYIHGPKPIDVARKYVELTGVPELPPMWSMGFHQCRWSYYPENRVREVAQTFRDLEIPCDAIYLDIDYMDSYRCFTWNKTHFPEPTKMIDDLKDMGFHTVVMIDPGIYMDEEYEIYKDGKEKDVFCKRADGTIMNGPVWPPECAFPDYTDPRVRDWWGPKYADLYLKNHVSGFWNDMNEPAVFQVLKLTFPDDVRHDYEGQSSTHSKAHNVYGMQMVRATYEGLKKLNPEKRPFVITRATYSGGQRFSSAWTGDNVASWEHLRIANIQCQRMSISGMSFIGTDIGGFVDYPDGELFVRWLQLGAFHPLYRVHSMGNNDDGSAEADKDEVAARDAKDRMDQEPWAFGKKYTPLAKEAIEFRYQILPYLYTAFRDYTVNGDPILKPVSFEDPFAKSDEQDFIFGKNILVSPVTKAKSRKKTIQLPEGKWYNWNTDELCAGRSKTSVKTTLNEIPMFIKAGSVIPFYPVRQSTSDENIEQLTLHIYYTSTGSETCELYEDKGEGYSYQNNNFSLKKFVVNGDTNSLKISQSKSGEFKTLYDSVQLIFHGLPFDSPKCSIDGEEIALIEKNVEKKSIFSVVIEEDFSEIFINN